MNRCAAPIKTKAWYPTEFGRGNVYHNQPARCSSKAKEGSLFCGVHKHLAKYIESIVWKCECAETARCVDHFIEELDS